jgi:tripartite-type tricarboxylate transporter receptor subunit TctC
MSARLFVRGFAALALLAPGALAFAQNEPFPSRPVRMVVPYPPGGFTDILGRLVADRLGPRVGQPVVVENRGGGGSTIGTDLVAKAPADGYSVLLVAPDLAINESLLAKLPYSALRDFAPVMQAAWSPVVLVTHPSVPAASVKELIELAKAEPGKINFASGGNGTGAHLMLELFKSRAGIDVVHVPYKGVGPATAGVLGGQVSGMFLQMAVARQHIAAGKLRGLATPSAQRSPAMPDLPTVSEAGLPGFNVVPWFGFVVRAGTPTAIVNRLNAELAAVLQMPDVRKQLADNGAEAVTGTPVEFAAFIQSEITRWAKVVKESGAKVD